MVSGPCGYHSSLFGCLVLGVWAIVLHAFRGPGIRILQIFQSWSTSARLWEFDGLHRNPTRCPTAADGGREWIVPKKVGELLLVLQAPVCVPGKIKGYTPQVAHNSLKVAHNFFVWGGKDFRCPACQAHPQPPGVRGGGGKARPTLPSLPSVATNKREISLPDCDIPVFAKSWAALPGGQLRIGSEHRSPMVSCPHPAVGNEAGGAPGGF